MQKESVKKYLKVYTNTYCFPLKFRAVELEIATMAGNTTAATTQITQLYPQLFVERLYPRYTAAAIDQYTTEIVVVTDCFFFFSFE